MTALRFSACLASRGTSRNDGPLLTTVLPDIDSTPHFDSVERLLPTIPNDSLEAFLEDRMTTILNKHQIRSDLVDPGRVVAIDGTQKLVRHQVFAPEATRQKVSGKSVLIAGDGFTLPLPAEFCENVPDADPESKQDCELKAFHCLAKRRKRWFRRRRLILVMDGLFRMGQYSIDVVPTTGTS